MDGKDLKVTKMDNRHSGISMFSHYVIYSPKEIPTVDSKIKHFLELRRWFTKTLGQGMEREFALDITDTNDVIISWAWHTVDGYKRIYMTPKAYTLFALTWL